MPAAACTASCAARHSQPRSLPPTSVVTRIDCSRLAPPILRFPADPGGSAQSSPSKAGSLAPLLRSHPGRSVLIKFPSGLSAVSSHDNPMFDEAEEAAAAAAAGACSVWGNGDGSTQQSVLPQHAGAWELQSAAVTQQALAQAQALAAQQQQDQQRLEQQQQREQQRQAAEDAFWQPDVLAMLERKGATGAAEGMPLAERRRWCLLHGTCLLHSMQASAVSNLAAHNRLPSLVPMRSTHQSGSRPTAASCRAATPATHRRRRRQLQQQQRRERGRRLQRRLCGTRLAAEAQQVVGWADAGQRAPGGRLPAAGEGQGRPLRVDLLCASACVMCGCPAFCRVPGVRKFSHMHA